VWHLYYATVERIRDIDDFSASCDFRHIESKATGQIGRGSKGRSDDSGSKICRFGDSRLRFGSHWRTASQRFRDTAVDKDRDSFRISTSVFKLATPKAKPKR